MICSVHLHRASGTQKVAQQALQQAGAESLEVLAGGIVQTVDKVVRSWGIAYGLRANLRAGPAVELHKLLYVQWRA